MHREALLLVDDQIKSRITQAETSVLHPAITAAPIVPGWGLFTYVTPSLFLFTGEEGTRTFDRLLACRGG